MAPTSDPSTLSDRPSVRAAIDELGMEMVALRVRRQHLVHRAGELERSDVEVARSRPRSTSSTSPDPGPRPAGDPVN